MLAKKVFTLATATAVLVASLTILPATSALATAVTEWTPSVPLSASGFSSEDPVISVNPFGYATAVWGASSGGNRVIHASTSRSGGPWSAPVTISDPSLDSDSPKIVASPSGVTTVLWASVVNGVWVLYSNTVMFGLWADPVVVAGTVSEFDISADATGRTIAVWSSSVGSKWALQSSSSLTGRPWTSPVAVSDETTFIYEPRVAVDPTSGRTTAIWIGSSGLQSSSSLNGGTWTSRVPVSTLAQSGNVPQITADSTGRTTAVWQGSTNGKRAIFSSSSQSGGTWTPAQLISDAANSSDKPQITADSTGRATAVWRVYTADSDSYVLYASSSPSPEIWTTPVPISDPNESSDYPQIVVDSTGRTTAVWGPAANSGTTLIFSSSSQSGGPWTDPAVLSNTTSENRFPQIALDSSGIASVVWRSGLVGNYAVQSSQSIATLKSFTTTTTPTISGAARVGQTLTAGISGWWTWSPTPTAVTYTWKRADTGAVLATGETYVPQLADVGATLTVTATAERAGYLSAEVTSAPSAAVARGAFETTPAPTISGTAQVGQLLTADVGTWPANTTLSYAWRQIGSGTVLATTDTYTPVAADLGKYVTVTVTASLTGYYDAVVTSAPSAVVAVGAFGTPVAPTITGTAQLGQELRVSTGAWASGATFTYVWKRSGTTAGTTVGSTEKYSPVAADIGKTLSVTVTATRAGFTTLTTPAAVTAAVLGKPFTTAPTPTITGKTTTGSTLTAVTGTWAPSKSVVFTYVWKRATGVGGTPTPIAKATSKTYKLVAADKGKYVSVTVTASLTGYAKTSRTSAATLMAN